MTTVPTAVKCPWCGAQPTEPCMAPPGPGEKKKLFNREPLRLSRFHPSRIEAAMKLDGCGEGEIERALSKQLAAATMAYRQQDGCAPVPGMPAPATQPHADTPEGPSDGATARAMDDSARSADAPAPQVSGGHGKGVRE